MRYFVIQFLPTAGTCVLYQILTLDICKSLLALYASDRLLYIVQWPFFNHALLTYNRAVSIKKENIFKLSKHLFGNWSASLKFRNFNYTVCLMGLVIIWLSVLSTAQYSTFHKPCTIFLQLLLGNQKLISAPEKGSGGLRMGHSIDSDTATTTKSVTMQMELIGDHLSMHHMDPNQLLLVSNLYADSIQSLILLSTSIKVVARKLICQILTCTTLHLKTLTFFFMSSKISQTSFIEFSGCGGTYGCCSGTIFLR